MAKNLGTKIKKVYKLNDDLQELLEDESEKYKKATENRDKKININRGGELVEATEGELWEEVRVVGLGGEAAELLRKTYPEVFEAAEKREKKNQEMHDYIQKEFGFSFRHMGIADYMKLTEALIEYHKDK